MIKRRMNEAKESMVFMLVLSNGNPALLNNHLWFFDPYLGERLFRIANREIKDKGLQIKDVKVDVSNIKGNLLDSLDADEKNVVVDNKEDFNKLIDYIIKNGKSAKQDNSKQLAKTKDDMQASKEPTRKGHYKWQWSFQDGSDLLQWKQVWVPESKSLEDRVAYLESILLKRKHL